MQKQMKAAVTSAILAGDIDTWCKLISQARKIDEANRLRRGPTEADIKLARMRKARGMSYSKWALGESDV